MKNDQRKHLSERANALLQSPQSVERWIDAVSTARAIDGASGGGSMLAETVYTAPDRPKKCEHCGRPTAFFEGCSVVECPMRRPVTAQPREVAR